MRAKIRVHHLITTIILHDQGDKSYQKNLTNLSENMISYNKNFMNKSLNYFKLQSNDMKLTNSDSVGYM